MPSLVGSEMCIRDRTLPVTAVFSLEPGFSLLYRATPAFVIPAPDFVDLKYFLVLGGCLSLALPPLANACLPSGTLPKYCLGSPNLKPKSFLDI